MSFLATMFKLTASRNDRRRDAAIALPQGVKEYRDISYGPYDRWNLLDVYCPEGTQEPLPTIVSVHGGGYVYGNKEIYRRYGMDMARRGFAFVNFNYRLAPKWRFPTPLYETNRVMQWLCANAKQYHMDPTRIILVGDSAGAQIASQYAAIATNPSYAAQFPMAVPPITIRCVGLYCGLYDVQKHAAKPRAGLYLDYLGKARDLSVTDPRLQMFEAITADYPPTFLTTACHDFLRAEAPVFRDLLNRKGIPCRYQCYGSQEDRSVGHVFHLFLNSPEAQLCNDESAGFFRKFL